MFPVVVNKRTLPQGLTYAIAGMIGVVSLWIALIGLPWSVQQPEGGPIATVWQANPLGIIPLIGALLVLRGLYLRKLGVAWIGTLILVGFTGASIFSMGSIFIPLVGLLVLFLALHQYLQQRRSTVTT